MEDETLDERARRMVREAAAANLEAMHAWLAVGLSGRARYSGFRLRNAVRSGSLATMAETLRLGEDPNWEPKPISDSETKFVSLHGEAPMWQRVHSARPVKAADWAEGNPLLLASAGGLTPGLVRRFVVKNVFPWVVSRASMLFLAARTGLYS